MITISTKNYINGKTVSIDGHEYIVRNLGAGDRLDLSQIASELMKLRTDALNSKEKSQEEQIKILKKIAKLMESMNEVYERCFNDGGNGSKSKQLIKLIGIDNANNMLKEIFENENV